MTMIKRWRFNQTTSSCENPWSFHPSSPLRLRETRTWNCHSPWAYLSLSVTRCIRGTNAGASRRRFLESFYGGCTLMKNCLTMLQMWQNKWFTLQHSDARPSSATISALIRLALFISKGEERASCLVPHIYEVCVTVFSRMLFTASFSKCNTNPVECLLRLQAWSQS